MLITESQMSIGRQTNVMNLLDNISYLTEAESVYAPAMVPVVESNEYQAHLIKLEDMMAFAESNGIEDLGYALTLVCEASEIDPSTVAFTVQEESIIADPEVASLAGSIMNEGVRIAAIPVNSNLVECWAIDKAVNQLIGSFGENCTMLEALCKDDYDTFIEETEFDYSDTGGYSKNSMAGMSAPTAGDVRKDQQNNTDSQTNGESAKVEGFINKIKKGAYKGRNWLAKQLARLNAWARDINNKINKTRGTKEATIFQKIKNMLAKAISWVTQKLANAVGDTSNKYGDEGFKKIEDHDFSLSAKKDA